MRLLRARYKNWCQHEDRLIEFSDGLNAIRGPNGSGKTNLLTGIVFALTGDFSRNPGVKVDNIYQLAGEKAKAGVSVDLCHGPAELTIERNLRPNSQKLIIKGQAEPITKADEINAKIQETLGANERLITDYVFVDQWKLFAFIDQSPGVRLKAFGELFNAAKAEQIWKSIGDFKIVVPVPAVDGDRVRVRIAETKAEINQLQEELAKYNHLPDKWKYEQDPLHTVVQQYNHKLDVESRLNNLKLSVQTANNAITEVETKQKSAQADLASWRKLLDENKEAAEQAKVDLASWNAYETANRARAMLENEIQQLTKERDVRTAPAKPDCYCGPSYQEHEEKLANMRADLATHLKFLKTFDPKSGLAECPECGTPTVQLHDKVNQTAISCAKLRNDISALSGHIMGSKQYDAAMTQFVEWMSHNKSALHVAQARLVSLGTGHKQPVQDKSQLTQLVNDYEHMGLTVGRLEQELHIHNSRLSGYRGHYDAINNQLTTLKLEYANLQVTGAQAHEAQMQLEQTQEQINLRNNLRYKLDMKIRLLRDDEASLDKFKIVEYKANKLRRLGSHLDEVRDVFKELPQVAAQACLDSMIEDINDVLERFDAPFRVLNADDLKFTVRKHSGVTMPAERLSGGEKAVFALAFRISVNSKFAGSLGLLCLDEPTAGLDEDNVACLEVALGRLRELSTSRGLQVVLITHETGLDGLFDRVIKLSPTH